jgi:hypothetical protein
MRYLSMMILFVGFLLASCKKPTSGTQQKAKQLIKIASSATDFRSFTYDANKHLTNHTIQFVNVDGPSIMSVNFSYLDGLINTASSSGGSVFYETEGQQVKVVRSFRPMGSEISVINFSYNNRGQLTEWRERFGQPEVDQPKESKQTFEYYADGNLKRIMYYLKFTNDGAFLLSGSALYDQYDQFKNPEVSFPGTVYLPNVVFHKNNFRRIRYYAANGDLYQTSTFDFAYDADGYPATKLYKDDRSTVPILFTFTYQ